MKPGIARALVAGSSAAVLMLEILAGRLLAPYVGVSLETFTGIIGVVLAGIAAGAWAGGALADLHDARRLIGPALVIGGGLTWLVLPILDALGDQFGGGGVAIVTLSLGALFLPAAVLTAVSPMVAKLSLRDLGETGAIVGGLSAAGTLGALAGTFITGFVLVSALPTRLTVMIIGGVLVAAGAVTHGHLARSLPSAATAVFVLVAALLAATSNQPCQFETGYFCGSIAVDEANPSGRSLYLDGLRHAYVDLEDPTNLDVRYIRLFARVADSLPPGPLTSLHIGGGGFSLPRYLQNERTGSSDLVLEIDPNLVTLVEDELGLVQSDSLQVHVGDARLALDELSTDTYDLVVGDAFASRSVPWHLTTREFLGEIERVLHDRGIYVMNVIDGPRVRFGRAELATLRQVFDHVVAVLPPEDATGAGLGNYVLVASPSPLPNLQIDPSDGRLLGEADTAGFIGDAEPLRDDFAPVDQLLGS